MNTKLICTLASGGGDGVIEGCADGNCPTIYETSSGSFIIQGFKVPSLIKNDLAVAVGLNEDAIEVPKELIEKFLSKMIK